MEVQGSEESGWDLVVLELEKLLAELVVLAQPLVVVLQDDHVAP